MKDKVEGTYAAYDTDDAIAQVKKLMKAYEDAEEYHRLMEEGAKSATMITTGGSPSPVWGTTGGSAIKVSPMPSAWASITASPRQTKSHSVKVRINPDSFKTPEEAIKHIKKSAAMKLAKMLMEDGAGIQVAVKEGNKNSKTKVFELTINVVLE